MRHRTRAAAREGARDGGRLHHRRRLAYVHLRCARRVLDGRGFDGHGRRHGRGRNLVQGALRDPRGAHGQTGQVGLGQGRHPPSHRPDRRGRRALPVARIRRPGHPPPDDGRSVHDREHGHRSGREERHLPGGPALPRLPEGARCEGAADLCGRPGRSLRAHGQNRSVDAEADGGVPAPAGEHAPDRPRREGCDRSGGDWLVHQRTHRRSAHRREGDEGQEGGAGRPLHRYPRHPAHLSAGDGGRAAAAVRGGWLRRLDADLRTVPRRLHGHPRQGRKVRRHDEPQLRRPHGPRGIRNLPREPRRRGRLGRGQPSGRPRRAGAPPGAQGRPPANPPTSNRGPS